MQGKTVTAHVESKVNENNPSEKYVHHSRVLHVIGRKDSSPGESRKIRRMDFQAKRPQFAWRRTLRIFQIILPYKKNKVRNSLSLSNVTKATRETAKKKNRTKSCLSNLHSKSPMKQLTFFIELIYSCFLPCYHVPNENVAPQFDTLYEPHRTRNPLTPSDKGQMVLNPFTLGNQHYDQHLHSS